MTVTLFHGTAGYLVGTLALIGAATIATTIWDWLCPKLAPARPVKTGWRVELPDGTCGIVEAVYPPVYDQPALALLEHLCGPDGEGFGDGSGPQAAVVPADDCTRMERQTLREALRSIRPAVTKAS